MSFHNHKTHQSELLSFLKENSSYFDFDTDIFIKALSKRKASSVAIIELAKELSVDPFKLWTMQIDKKALHQKLIDKNNLILPERFTKAAFSSSTSLSSVIDQARKYGQDKFILNKLQISSEYLNAHRPLSIMAVNEALMECSHYFSQNDLDSIGLNNSRKFMQSEFGDKIKEAKSLSKMYELFVENIHLVETNWSYKILKCDKNEIIINTAQSDKIQHELSAYCFTNTLTSSCRLSFIRNISYHLGHSNVRVYKINTKTKNSRSKSFTFSVCFKDSFKRPVSKALFH